MLSKEGIAFTLFRDGEAIRKMKVLRECAIGRGGERGRDTRYGTGVSIEPELI